MESILKEKQMQQKEERKASMAAGESLAGLGCGSCFSSIIVRMEDGGWGGGLSRKQEAEAARLRLVLQVTAWQEGQGRTTWYRGWDRIYYLSEEKEGSPGRLPANVLG